MIFGCLITVVSLVIGAVNIQIDRIATARTRAQAAADAVALAAVAEAGPYGGSDPVSVARRYARANGAALLACSCAPGGSAVQVEVALDGTSARARAVLEVALLAPSRTASGVHPALRQAVDALIAHSEGALWITSGFRDRGEQTVLWNEALVRYGDPEIADDWVAPPGSSFHEQGLAVDVGGNLGLIPGLIEELGLPLHRPLANEPWHLELLGSRS